MTVAANLRLNAALAAAPLTPDTAAEVWSAFAGPWTAWNRLRMAAASLAFVALAAAGAPPHRPPETTAARSGGCRPPPARCKNRTPPEPGSLPLGA